jgi:diguanylate cyclase (GGDEF)-like protein
MKKILLIEDSQFFQGVVKNAIEQDGHYEVIAARSLKEAREKLHYLHGDIFLALVDVALPDAPNGEAVQMCKEKEIPTVIFSSKYDEAISNNFHEMGAIDYVIKSAPTSVSYMKNLIARLEKNKSIFAMIVEPNEEARAYFVKLLERYFIKVVFCDTVSEARKIFTDNKDNLSLLFIGGQLGQNEQDAYKLLQNVRKISDENELIVIGTGEAGQSSTISRFLKFGANDYVSHFCTPEEFISRVSQNLDMLDRIEDLMDAAHKDFMTGLYNRRFMFDAGDKQYEASKRAEKNIAVAIMDIDFFKKVNDTYGHDAGDYVIKKVAAVIQDQFRCSDMVCRMGGEEFCVITPNMIDDNIASIFDRLRQEIEQTEFEFEGTKIPITISIGVCAETIESLEQAVTKADLLLYDAKNDGRNNVKVG